MKEFIEAYNLILADSYPIKPEYIGMNIFKILDEWVESPDLVEFPKELQIELCKALRRRFDSIYIISFKKIAEILEKYDYEYVDDVIDGMKKFDALNRCSLLLVSVNVDENINLEENETLKLIKENFSDAYDNAYSVFSDIYNNKECDGLTVLHRDTYDPENAYVCIYINRSSFQMKDTLEHELTHLVRSIANYSNKFPKTYSNVTSDKIKNRKYECVVFIEDAFRKMNFSETVINAVGTITIRAFTDREEQPTIKSIVNSFIRRYEKDDKRYEFNHLLKTIPQIEGKGDHKGIASFRESWIDKFLSYVNSYKIFEDYKKLLEDYFLQWPRAKNYEVEFILKCISYLCFKFQYPEYDIDRIVKENFKKFKFRDA